METAAILRSDAQVLAGKTIALQVVNFPIPRSPILGLNKLRFHMTEPATEDVGLASLNTRRLMPSGGAGFQNE